jgi:hypothetical protein
MHAAPPFRLKLNTQLQSWPSLENPQTATPYWEVGVEAFSGETPLLRPGQDALFDLASLLAHGLRNGQIHLYNCSCGNPYCQQITEPVHQVVRDDALYWSFSERSFRTRLEPRALSYPQWLAVRLSKTQVRDELDRVVQELVELESRTGARVLVLPDNGLPKLDWPIERVLREMGRKHKN